uniref:Uncharacterized protein n=1 Tax=Rhizophagus irregularis (strain DAOM 181602 / DAOM 197198 / MUCL 43194) TaxID=747089 RepID=U9UTI8_RHIID
MLENIISEWIRCINKYYEINRDGNYQYRFSNTNYNQLESDILGFVEANEALAQEQANTSNNQLEVNKALAQEQANTSTMQSHPQAYYTSRKLTEIFYQDETEGLELAIKD